MPEFTVDWVLVKADYEGTGLVGSMGESVDYVELGLPFELWGRLDRWLGWFDESYGTPEFNDVEFSHEGFVIATAVKAEVPEWEVQYYDVATDSQYEILIEEEETVSD